MRAATSIWSRYVNRLFGRTPACGPHRRSGRYLRRRGTQPVGIAAELLEERALLSGSGSGQVELAGLLDVGDRVDSHAAEQCTCFLPPGLQNSLPQPHDQDAPHGPFELPWDLSASDSGPIETQVFTTAAMYPLSSVPALHSNFGAPATLFLDFDGHFEPLAFGVSNVTTPAYDFDGDASTFSDVELANIEAIWFRVAEDFAPFNLDVTTVEPAVLAAGTPSAAANGVALRVAIGGTNFTGNGYGGISALNSFTNSAVNIAYSFSQGNSTPAAGNVVSHEAGHAFGLMHQAQYDANGILTSGYSLGDLRTWTPIMGASMWSTIIQTWHNGPTGQGPTNYQDDMAIIANATNGFGYRGDDHGNTMTAATPLSLSGNTGSDTGIVGTNADIDIFSFDITTTDTYSITVNGLIGPSGDMFASNLDVVLELRDSAGSLMATANPQDSRNAEIRDELAPGTYFVAVKSTGTYGWVGQYTVNIGTPPAGITVTPASRTLTTAEDGRQTSYTVVLETQPTADVIVPISSSNTAEGTLSAASLVFTSANWDIPQVVTITGVSDGIVDNDITYSVEIGTVLTADTDYAGLDPADMTVVNVDNDAAGFMFLVNPITDTIDRSRLSGAQLEAVVDLRALYGASDVYNPQGIAVDLAHGKMYWADSSAGRIQRANLDGSVVETVVSGTVSGDIVLDAAAGKMYWNDSQTTTRTIKRANLDGSEIQVLVTDLEMNISGIALDIGAGKIYWGASPPTAYSDGPQGNIRRANLDGTNSEILVADVGRSLLALDVAAGKLYWSDNWHKQIRRADLSGTNVEVVVETATYATQPVGLYSIVGLAIDVTAGKLYWNDGVTKTLYRANLDGSIVSSLGPGKTNQQLAIAHPGPEISVTHRTGLVTSEDGISDVFRVALTTQPTANVTIAISNGDPTEGTLSTSSLTFTPANWNITQTVTVTGVADTLFDGDIPYTITLAPAVSSDPIYNGLNPADVSVINRDKAALQTKFYVVDDATQNKTFEYNASGGLVESYNVNSGNSAPRGAASTIAGDKVWVVDANRKVYVYDRSGALLGSWTAGTLSNSATVEGIAVSPNGADVWIVDAKSDKVFYYAGAATRLSGSQTATSSFSLNSGNTTPKDITTDGVSLWVVNDSTTDKVFKYTVAGSLAGSWTIDPANSKPTGLTIDPANVSNIWIVDSGTDRIYQYNGAATRTSGSQTAAATYALAAGNTNPQGIADPPAGIGEALTPTSVQSFDSFAAFDGKPPSPNDLDSLFRTLAANFDLSGDEWLGPARGNAGSLRGRAKLSQRAS